MSSSDSSAETKRAIGWLGLAALFFAVILWWKSDKIFGENTPKPPPEPSFQPIRSEDPDAPKIAVTVVDDKTGSPLADARVAVLNKKGEVLADELTTSLGMVEARPKSDRVRGVVAWHEDYAIRATLTTTGPIEIRLRTVSYAEIDFGEIGPARLAWFGAASAGITLKYNRSAVNPMAAKEGFLEFKMCDHLGLRDKLWSVKSNPARVPRYLPFEAKARMTAKPDLPNHLDIGGMRDREPPKDRAGRRTESDPVILYKDWSKVKLLAPPSSPHVFVGHYVRQPDEQGVLMVHLRQLDRDPASPNYGNPITTKSGFSTFEEKDGTATFRVYDLDQTTFYPTVLVFLPGATRKTIRCNPVEIDGVTEAKLTPLEYGKLTVNTNVSDGTIRLLDDRLEPVINAGPQVREGGSTNWIRIEPITYRVVSQTKTHASLPLTVRVAPGKHKKVEVELRPATRVTLVLKLAAAPAAIRVRDKATGSEHEFLKGLYERNFDIKLTGKGAARMMRMTGHRHELFLPHGDYEFTLVGEGDAVIKVVPVTIKGTTQDVSLD